MHLARFFPKPEERLQLARAGAAVPGKADKVLKTPLGRYRDFEKMYYRGWLNTLTYLPNVYRNSVQRCPAMGW